MFHGQRGIAVLELLVLFCIMFWFTTVLGEAKRNRKRRHRREFVGCCVISRLLRQIPCFHWNDWLNALSANIIWTTPVSEQPLDVPRQSACLFRILVIQRVPTGNTVCTSQAHSVSKVPLEVTATLLLDLNCPYDMNANSQHEAPTVNSCVATTSPAMCHR